jgi:NADH-quinone oxidoreductase subunit N
MVLALASIAGLPPFAGFYGKAIVWISLVEDIYLYGDAGSYVLFIVNLAVSLIIIFYYIRLIVLIFIGHGFESAVVERVGGMLS